MSPTLERCALAEKKNVEKARKSGCVFAIDCQQNIHIFLNIEVTAK